MYDEYSYNSLTPPSISLLLSLLPESTSTSGGEEDEDGFRKRKKPRTAFSREQVGDLEKKFQEKKYLSSAERGELAERLKLSDMQVWYHSSASAWQFCDIIFVLYMVAENNA